MPPNAIRAARTGGSFNPSEAAGTVCPLCGGAGWLRQDLPVGHPQFGVPVLCRCQQEKAQQERLSRLFELSRLGEQLRDMTFDTFYTNARYDEGVVSGTAVRQDISRNLKKALSTATAFAKEPHAWLVLLGEYGCGKTHLAVAIANYRIAIGEPVLFQVVPDLLDHLRAAFSPNSPVTYDTLFEEVRSAPLLILDDLGAHSGSPWAEEKLFQIVNHRNNHLLPTVVTTNLPLEKLPPRLVSRMTVSGSILLAINAPDYRGGIAAAPTPASVARATGRGLTDRR